MTQYSCRLKLLVCGHIMIGGLLFYSVFILGLVVYWQETIYQLLRPLFFCSLGYCHLKFNIMCITFRGLLINWNSTKWFRGLDKKHMTGLKRI
jgi:hypothetical protein